MDKNKNGRGPDTKFKSQRKQLAGLGYETESVPPAASWPTLHGLWPR